MLICNRWWKDNWSDPDAILVKRRFIIDKCRRKRIEEKNRDPDARNQQNVKPSIIKYIRYQIYKADKLIKIYAGDKELKFLIQNRINDEHMKIGTLHEY